MEVADVVTGVIAALALAISTGQWLHTQRGDRLRLLLGEKETVGYEALRLARKPGARVSEEVVRALVLATLLERSDRARLQVYRALDCLPPRHKKEVIALRLELLQSARRYGHALDMRRFEHRLGQLEAALPWTRNPDVRPDVPATREGNES